MIEMLLGIDVGGTFTDAVIIHQDSVLAQAKTPTIHEDILQCVMTALDKVLLKEVTSKLKRVVISSTLVTNALTEDKLVQVPLIVIPGPGMNIQDKLPVVPYYLGGYVDHRGKVTAEIDWNNHSDLFNGKDAEICAVSGKFAVRNPVLEYQAACKLQKYGYSKCFLGSELSGELNFIRRTNSAYFSAQVYKLFVKFCKSIELALEKRGVTSPVHILKADGGTLPLMAARNQPVEAVFTGPAASILGIEALVAPEINTISLDVGGTTTDIAFWENGFPLRAKRGAVIKGYPTAVRTFHMRSIGIGGDSCINKTAAGYIIGPERKGPSVAVGGKEATLSDALIVAGYVHFGDKNKALSAIAVFGDNPVVEAQKIIAAAVDKIKLTIMDMLKEWSKQPVYTVGDVIEGTEFKPQQLIGIGGGAFGLVKALGEAMQLPVKIPLGAVVANAVGAAVARSTLSVGLRADITEGYYVIPESGCREKIPSNFDKQKAIEFLNSWLYNKTINWLLPDKETELVSYEHFPTVHGYYNIGDIYSLRMQLKPGILSKVCAKEVSF